MPKTLILALAMLIPSAWLQAQQGNPPSEPGKTSGKTAGPTTIEGCLQSAGGQFSLTGSDGTVHRLSYSKKLNPHIGHEVEITGKPSVSTVATTTYGAGSSAEDVPIFEVKAVKHIADTCKSPDR